MKVPSLTHNGVCATHDIRVLSDTNKHSYDAFKKAVSEAGKQQSDSAQKILSDIERSGQIDTIDKMLSIIQSAENSQRQKTVTSHQTHEAVTINPYDQNHLQISSQISNERLKTLSDLEVEADQVVDCLHDVNKLLHEQNRTNRNDDLLGTVLERVENSSGAIDQSVSNLRGAKQAKRDATKAHRKRSVKRIVRTAVAEATCTVS